MAIPWTLEKELCGLVDATSVGDVLCRLRVIKAPGVTSRRGRRQLRAAIKWLNSTSGRSIDESRAAAIYTFHAADVKNEGARWP